MKSFLPVAQERNANIATLAKGALVRQKTKSLNGVQATAVTHSGNVRQHFGRVSMASLPFADPWPRRPNHILSFHGSIQKTHQTLLHILLQTPRCALLAIATLWMLPRVNIFGTNP